MSLKKQLQEKRAKVHADLAEVLKSEMTVETRAKRDAMIADIDVMSADIAAIEKADKIAEELRNSGSSQTREIAANANRGEVLGQFESINKRYISAFRNALRSKKAAGGFGPDAGADASVPTSIREALEAGVAYERAASQQEREERDGLVEGAPMLNHIGTYSGLGFFVPTGFVNAIEQATKWYAPLLDGSVLNVMSTATGQPLPFPTSNDTNQKAVVVDEVAPVSEQDVTAGQITMGAYKLTSGLVKCSLELLQDSAFDIESWLAQRFAERWGRGMEAYLTTGTGSGQPTGLLTDIAASGATAVVAAGSSTNDGVTANDGTNSIGYQDLVNLEHSVDPSYRRGAKYMFSDKTLAHLKTRLDKFGRPLWVPGVANSAPDTINGRPYVINQSMPQIAAGNTTVIFGDFSKFMVRKVKDLSVLKLVERYAEFGQVAFISFARIDSRLIDAGTHPLNVLVQHT
jgi:HK97 family phage major capsid protein